MKKIKILLSTMLMGIVGLTSCNSASDKAATGDSAANGDTTLAAQNQNEEALTPEEYSKRIKYVGEYAEKAQKFLDMQNADPNSAEAKEGMEKLAQEYPDYEAYQKSIVKAPKDRLSEEDIKEIEKYQGYVYFTVPEWYSIQTAGGDVAGFIEETPSTSTTEKEGVVAEPVETETIKDR